MLPLASVGAGFVHFILQSLVLVAALAGFRWSIDWAYLWLVIPATVVLVLFSASLAVLLAAVNVKARDTQHLLELVLLAWFWLTPIVYPFRLLADQMGSSVDPAAAQSDDVDHHHVPAGHLRPVVGEQRPDGTCTPLLPGRCQPALVPAEPRPPRPSPHSWSWPWRSRSSTALEGSFAEEI